MKDNHIVFRRIRSGDWDSFSELFEEYSGQLYAYAYAFVGDRQTAEDIIQDTFVYLWTHRDRIDWHEATYGYILRSVRNACINHKLHRTVDLKYRDSVNVEQWEVEDFTPEQEALDELRAKMAEQLERLPEKCREIFLLGTLESMSYADIADSLGISVNTVKTQMQRARGKLFGKK
jgi:RNA polymerase sigma-70 factor (ECF subfamily)